MSFQYPKMKRWETGKKYLRRDGKYAEYVRKNKMTEGGEHVFKHEDIGQKNHAGSGFLWDGSEAYMQQIDHGFSQWDIIENENGSEAI